MSDRRDDNVNNTDKTEDVVSWVIIVILMTVMPPVGLIMLLAKLGVFGKKPNFSNNVRNAQGENMSNNVFSTLQSASNKIASNTNNSSYGTVWDDKQCKRRRNRLFKKTGKGVAVLLLLIAMVSFAMGLVGVLNAISQYGIVFNFDLGFSTFWLLGGITAFLVRNTPKNSFSRYKNYYAFMEGRDIVPLQELAQVAGVSQKAVVKDLQAMVNSDFLPVGSYIDNELECLVIVPSAAEKMRMEIKDFVEDSLQMESVSECQYKATLAELREVSSFIVDETISGKVKRLTELTTKIFHIVEEHPQKQSQLRRFTSYYLPTTLKLVRSYATLEKQGEKGENIMSAKRSISDILDTLGAGFEQQLDQLFKSDAMDIAADINVLENLMKQDGLKEDKLMAQVLEG